MQYRKKPVVIEAVKLQVVDGGPSGPDGNLFNEHPEWLTDAIGRGDIQPAKPNDTDFCDLEIKTLEGVMRVNAGDWIIKGIKGELYPCKPDIFAATYEPVD